ncbi:unnamed protein product [Schistosoma turkestanicum]|nr:unnamed protein product [Schistosoma turkestanicum]
MDSLISCYVDSLQILPLEIQSRITEYLQSDLQKRHLLSLAKRTVDKIQESVGHDIKKKHLDQLILILVAVQNICDRRISDLDELDEVIETHSLKLMNAKMKVDTNDPQRSHLNTENVPESEINSGNLEVSNTQYNGNLLRRNSAQESSYDKCISYPIPNARCNDMNFRGKERFPLRAVSTNSRNASRRSLNRWVPGVHRFKSVYSVSSTNGDNSLNSKGDSNNKSTSKTSVDLKQHKVGVAYNRYSRTQQQRFKSRVLSRPLHSNRVRPQYLEYATIRHGSRRRKNTVSKYTNPESFRNYEEANLVGSLKRRQEQSHSNSYKNDNYFGSSNKAVNELATEDKIEERDAYALLSLKSPKRLGDRSSDWNAGYNENENLIDIDCSNSNSHGTYDMGRDPSCSSQETQVIRTLTNQLTNAQNGQTSRQKMYRLRRASNNVQSYHRSDSSFPPASPEYGANRSCLTPQILTHSNTRRGCRSNNTARHKIDSQTNIRSPPGSPFRYGSHADDMNSFRHKVISENSPSHSISEASVSPDERLYCVCQKVSFGDMIACDNRFCEVEWFHFSCVDVRVQPKGKWYCPYCRGESSKIKRSDI